MGSLFYEAAGVYLGIEGKDAGGTMKRLKIWESRSNYMLNSAAPVTQTVNLLAGDYHFWIAGSGSVALTGGATGTATESSDVSFTLGATVDVIFTITGDVTMFQCEK